MEMHNSFALCASSCSWTTVIENSSNVKEIWNGRGIQAYTVFFFKWAGLALIDMVWCSS